MTCFVDAKGVRIPSTADEVAADRRTDSCLDETRHQFMLSQVYEGLLLKMDEKNLEAPVD